MPPNILRRIPSSLKLLLAKPTAQRTGWDLGSLPEDILLETAQHLPSVDLLNLALTHTRFLRMFLPTLYSSVDLRSNAQCQHTLTFLLTHAHIIRCIKSLIVRPNNEEWAQQTQDSMCDMESWVVVTIDQIARHLVNLQKFVWDGREFPKYDNVWKSLRKSCPDLRHVGVTVGLGDFTFRSRKIMPTNSALFKFSGLVGFTLTVKQLVGSGLHPPFDELPQSCWDMLLSRCPDLQHLTIDTVNERYIDVRPLFQGRWPSLRHLTLGDFVLLDAFNTVDPVETNNGLSMANFLAYHQSLEHLVLHQLEGWYFPLSLNLPPSALPKLKHVSARFLMLRHLPNVLSSLESLELVNHPHGVYRMSGALWAIGQLKLTSLRIWIDCHDSGDADVKSEHMKYFTDIFKSAPLLLHLDISCSSDPSFSMAELATALITPHRLRSLVITQVKKTAREGDALKDGAMLFRQSSTLQHLILQDAVARWRHPRDLRFQKIATFELVAHPPLLAVHELGINRRGVRVSRTYRHLLK